MSKTIHRLALIVLALNLSEAYRPLGVLLGLGSSAVLSSLTLAFCIFYCAVNHRTIRRLLSDAVFAHWSAMMLALPMIIMIMQTLLGRMSGAELIYWTAFNGLFYSLMLTAAIYTFNSSSSFLGNMYWGCITFAGLGFFINITNYEFVREVLEFTSNRIASQESVFRILGFFQHPNAAAFAILTYFLFLMQLSAKWGEVKKFIIACTMLVMVTITASRTSTILALLLCAIFLHSRLPSNHKNSLGSFTRSGQVIAAFFLAIGPLWAIPLLTEIQFETEALNRAVDRFSALIMHGVTADDESLTARSTILPQYLRYIVEFPIFGAGTEFITQKITTGIFSNVSQNAWVEWALRYGSIYPAYVAFVFFRSYKRARTLPPEYQWGFRVYLLLLLLWSFSVNDIFWYRAVVISIGLMLGLHLANRRSAFAGKVLRFPPSTPLLRIESSIRPPRL